MYTAIHENNINGRVYIQGVCVTSLNRRRVRATFTKNRWKIVTSRIRRLQQHTRARKKKNNVKTLIIP